MMKTFYEQLLPSDGIYCVVGIRDKEVEQEYAEDVDGVVTLVEQFKARAKNVFVSPASFRTAARNKDNALYCKSFFVDLDIGVKGYPTKQDADDALTKFLADTGLPPPVKIDSGRGLHAYWIFDTQVPAEDWKPYAERFKKFCRQSGLVIDPTVTADTARIMRSPETENFKEDPPAPTAVLQLSDTLYSFDKFRELLQDIEPDFDLSAVRGTLDEDTRKVALNENFETIFKDLAVDSLQGKGCGQIRYMLENPADVKEPLWRAGLSIAVHCTDGKTAIHMLSQDHPGYSPDETETKAEATHGKPQRCTTFELLNPEGCKDCKFHGQITNPLALGRRLRQVPEQDQNEAGRSNGQSAQESEATKAIFSLPKALGRFQRGVNGGIYYLPPDKLDKETGEKTQLDPILILPHDVVPVRRMRGGMEGDVLVILNYPPNDPPEEFILPISATYSTDDLRKVLPRHNIYPFPQNIKYIAEYFLAWATYLQQRESAEIMRSQMGWTDDGEAFVVGLTEVTRGGELRQTAASPMVRNISKALHVSGDLKAWKQGVALFGNPGFEVHAFGLYAGFASPLMRFTPVPGCTINLFSPETGFGKSAAMYAALSVFGNPHDLSVLEGNATGNGLKGRYISLKNITMGIDECTNISNEALSSLINFASQGKGKIRMQASVNAERELEASGAMLVLTTSNLDMYEKMEIDKANPEGEKARLIQFNLRKPGLFATDPMGCRNKISSLRTNYGHAGVEYIQQLMKMPEDMIRADIKRWELRFAKDYGDDTSFRFYSSAVSTCFAGAEIAKSIGLIDHDIEAVYTEVLKDLCELRDTTARLNDISYREIVNQFFNRHHAGYIVADKDRVIAEPRGPLVGRIDIGFGVHYIAKSEFRKFLSDKKLSAHDFEGKGWLEGVLTNTNLRYHLGKGWRAGGAVTCYGIALSAEDKHEFLDQIKRVGS
jgi:hypothetical protein